MAGPLPFSAPPPGEPGHPPRRSDPASYERTLVAEVSRVAPLTETETLYELALVDPAEERRFSFEPGQFLMLEVPGVGEAPFSVARSPLRRGALELLVRRAGNLTGFLARVSPGTRLGIRGPFGTSFPMEAMRGHDLLLVGGGLGLAPLRAVLARVQEDRPGYGRVQVVHGARTPSRLLLTHLYDGWRADGVAVHAVVETAEGGWGGAVGRVTEEVERVLRGREEAALRERSYAIVCGPPVMFRSVCDLLAGRGMPMERMFVSLERRMHCGVGKCCRCNVGSTYVCLGGPVFDYWTVMNLPEAI